MPIAQRHLTRISCRRRIDLGLPIRLPASPGVCSRYRNPPCANEGADSLGRLAGLAAARRLIGCRGGGALRRRRRHRTGRFRRKVLRLGQRVSGREAAASLARPGRVQPSQRELKLRLGPRSPEGVTPRSDPRSDAADSRRSPAGRIPAARAPQFFRIDHGSVHDAWIQRGNARCTQVSPSPGVAPPPPGPAIACHGLDRFAHQRNEPVVVSASSPARQQDANPVSNPRGSVIPSSAASIDSEAYADQACVVVMSRKRRTVRVRRGLHLVGAHGERSFAADQDATAIPDHDRSRSPGRPSVSMRLHWESSARDSVPFPVRQAVAQAADLSGWIGAEVAAFRRSPPPLL